MDPETELAAAAVPADAAPNRTADEAEPLDAGLSLDALLGDLGADPTPAAAAPPPALLGLHRCMRRTLIRDGYEAFSAVLGALEAGEVVDITEEQVLEIGASRLRFERPAGGSSNGGAAGPVGWVSANGPTGLPFLVLVGSDADIPEPASSMASATALPSFSSAQEPAVDEAVDGVGVTVAELDFPKKTLFGWGSTNAKTISSRQTVLAQWLSAVLRSAADDIDLSEFLNIPEGGSLERLVWGEPEIRSDDGGGSGKAQFVKYHLECFGTAGQHWKVDKRFSDFCALRDALIAKESTAPKQPATAAGASGAEEPVEELGPVVAVERVRMVSVVTRTDPDSSEQYTAFGITVFPRAVAASGGEAFQTGEEWTVYRRFSDFSELRAKLIVIDPLAFEKVEYPVRRLSMFGGGSSAKVNTERRVGLERWLTAVLQEPSANEPVSRFAAEDTAAPPAPKPEPTTTPAAATPVVAETTEVVDPAAEPPAWQVRKVKITPTAVADEAAAIGAKEDTAYTLRIYPRAEGVEVWEVCTKYSEFCTLRASLRASCGAVLRSNDRSFPVNRVWGWGGLNAKAADDRLAALQTWMDNVVGLRPDASPLIEFITPPAEEATGTDDPSPNTAVESVDITGGAGSAEAAAWGASLTTLLASPAGVLRSSIGGALRAAGSTAADSSTSEEATHAGRALPVPLDALWAEGNKMLTPTPCRGQPALVKPAGDMDSPVSFLRARAAAASPDQVTYPPRKQVDNAYTVELKGLLCPPMVDLFRVTHEHRPGLGFQPLVVERAAITNIVSKHVAGKEHTAYTLYCQPREGFGWSITKRFSDFAALRLVLGAAVPEVLQLEFPARWFPGMMLGSGETQRAAAETRRTILQAWLTEAIALCQGAQPLLLFFHGSSVGHADATGQEDEPDSNRDSMKDVLKNLALISHVTVRPVPLNQASGFWKGERRFLVWVFPEFGGDSWTIQRALADFSTIRGKLIGELEAVEGVDFPVVGWASPFGAKETEAVLSDRASALQAWVEGVLALARRNPLLLEFLQEDGSHIPDDTPDAAADAEGDAAIAEYQCLRRCQIRAEAAMDSEKAGIMEMGEKISALEEVVLESGVRRVRFDRGWCSIATGDGKAVLAVRSSPNSTPSKADTAAVAAALISGPEEEAAAESTAAGIGEESAGGLPAKAAAAGGGWFGSVGSFSPWRAAATAVAVATPEKETAADGGDSGSPPMSKKEEAARLLATKELTAAAGPGKGNWV